MQKFTLVENALDSLEHAIEHLTVRGGPSPADYKKVIMDVAHVVELLFKERLRNIHPAFVLEDVDKFPSTKARTIAASKAEERLEKIGNIEFDEADKAALKTVRETRNEIEHYEFKFNEDESKIVVGNILTFIFKFSSSELDLNWSRRRIEDPRWVKLNEYASFFEAQKAYLLEMTQNEEIDTIECPICRFVLFDVDKNACLLCGHHENVLYCSSCHEPFLYSDAGDEELCSECQWEDGYAAANFEKY